MCQYHSNPLALVYQMLYQSVTVQTFRLFRGLLRGQRVQPEVLALFGFPHFCHVIQLVVLHCFDHCNLKEEMFLTQSFRGLG